MALKPGIPDPINRDPLQKAYARIADLERRVANLERMLNGGAASQLPVYSALPTAGRQGRIVILATDGKIYRDTGAAWVAVG